MPQVAAILGVNTAKVRTWIQTGELCGINVAVRRGGRPRWRITSAGLESFVQARSSRTLLPVPRPPRPRTSAPPIRQYF